MIFNPDDYIDLLADKDDEAFRLVYDHTKNGVFSIIISFVHSRAVTEDLMQDTYIKMIEKIHQYKRNNRFNAWLVQIAKNTAIDYLRKYSKEFLYDPQENEHIHDSLATQPKTYEVLDLVKVLTNEEKQIVLLHAVSDMKFKDIAQIVNRPIGTVLWIYHKALKTLKKEWDYEK